MIQRFMIITTVILALFVAGGLMLSNSYEIKRSVTINAPVEKVHALIGDLNAWSQWFPWAVDKGVHTQILQAKGVGASQKWQGVNGEGSLLFTKSDLSGVDYELSFDKDGQAHKAGFEYTTASNQTVVTWYMQGHIETFIIGGYVAYLSQFMSVELFDKALLQLKTLAEN